MSSVHSQLMTHFCPVTDMPACAVTPNCVADKVGSVELKVTFCALRTCCSVACLTCRQPSFLAAPSMSAPAAGGGGGVPAAGPDVDPSSTFPFELLAFSLTDGRSGVLSFR